MKFERFEDIIAWQKSKQFAVDLYGIFGLSRDYSYKDQLLRAVISVMNNIAEGFEGKTNQEFIHFLYIAKGSCGEVRSMLCLGLELKYLSYEECIKLVRNAEEISRLLSGLIKSLRPL